MSKIGDIEKGPFFCHFCFKKGLEMPKERANMVFPTTFYPKKTYKKVEGQIWAKSEIRKNEVIFFALLRADLLFWAISGAHFCFKKGLKMPKKRQTWCFQPPFTLTKCTMKPDDKYERNRRYEKWGHFFALLRADLAVCGPVSGPVFSIFSPDMTNKMLFGPAAAKSSPLPFFWPIF